MAIRFRCALQVNHLEVCSKPGYFKVATVHLAPFRVNLDEDWYFAEKNKNLKYIYILRFTSV